MIITHALGIALASSSGPSDDGSWVPLLFLLSGPVFFFVMYTYYRNTDKRHRHETETSAEVVGMQAFDERVDHVTGSSYASKQDANHREVRGAGF